MGLLWVIKQLDKTIEVQLEVTLEQECRSSWASYPHSVVSLEIFQCCNIFVPQISTTYTKKNCPRAQLMKGIPSYTSHIKTVYAENLHWKLIFKSKFNVNYELPSN